MEIVMRLGFVEGQSAKMSDKNYRRRIFRNKNIMKIAFKKNYFKIIRFFYVSHCRYFVLIEIEDEHYNRFYKISPSLQDNCLVFIEETNEWSIFCLGAEITSTALAATRINAILTMLSKGTPELTKALKSQGLTLEDLQKKLKLPIEEGGGLINVMKIIKDVSVKSGVAVATLTGRVEAAKIIESIVEIEGENK